MNYKKLSKLSKVKDSELSVGDIYNDGTYEGKVVDITSDHITLESQNEDGDVVNIEIPIEDSVVSYPEFFRQALYEGFVIPEGMDKDLLDHYIDKADVEVMAYDEPLRVIVNNDVVQIVPIEDSRISDSKTFRVIYSCDGEECYEDFADRDSALDFADNLEEYQLKVIVDSKISDSDEKEQFIMNLLIHHKATCPKTGDWELKGDMLLNNGKEVASVSGTLEEGINKISQAIDDTWNSISDSEEDPDIVRLALDAVSDKNINDLYSQGITEVPIPEGINPKEFAKEVAFNVDSLWNLLPEDQNPPLAYDYDDASVYVYVK